SFTTGNSVSSSPAVADEVVYVGSRDGKLYAVDAESGQHRWSFRKHQPRLSPTVADGVVYTASDTTLYALQT
ncbi:PQQ-binding-like beta-propeller repeat protein, partial [Streptomyces sp. NPDC052015]|uniref:outer membrane protein assembly factor BamB family protein n=1 Tax=Streptomyces sp. NPDC052015 TaxID=3154755 RepID=UPI0034154DF1